MEIFLALLLLAGAVCFVLAMLGAPRLNWLAAGLLCWIAVPLITAFTRLLA